METDLVHSDREAKQQRAAATAAGVLGGGETVALRLAQNLCATHLGDWHNSLRVENLATTGAFPDIIGNARI